MIFRFNEFLFERSIGSENIRLKWYPDIPKRLFYKIIKIDPTSVRKKDFSKPGKYSKWLINQYKSGRLTDEMLNDKEYVKKLNYCLFIFSTGWYKNKWKNDDTRFLDINKFKIEKESSWNDFVERMSRNIEVYEEQTEKSKYDVVYSDDKISILIPINFSASYETAKNTEWCSQGYSGFSAWNQKSILFRIIPKSSGYDRVKLTWDKNDDKWYMACSKYPEIDGYGQPFDDFNGKETWEIMGIEQLVIGEYATEKSKINFTEIKKTISLVPDEAKQLIQDYHKKFYHPYTNKEEFSEIAEKPSIID